MTLASLLAVYLGFALECLWLWDAAGEKREIGRDSSITASGPSKPVRIMGITAAAGAALIGLAELPGENVVTLFLYDALSYLLMGAAMFFVLIAGTVGARLLPRVNEYNIISVLMIGAMTAYTNGYLPDPILRWALAAVLAVLLAAVVLQRSTPGTAGQVMLYVLYLGAIVFLTFQSALIAVLWGPDFSIQEGFLAGAAYAFLALHTLFAIRFAVLATSFVLPANRVYAPRVMRKIYRSDQVRPLVSLVFLGLVSALFVINSRMGLLPEATFAALLSIFSTQLLFRQWDSGAV